MLRWAHPPNNNICIILRWVGGRAGSWQGLYIHPATCPAKKEVQGAIMPNCQSFDRCFASQSPLDIHNPKKDVFDMLDRCLRHVGKRRPSPSIYANGGLRPSSDVPFPRGLRVSDWGEEHRLGGVVSVVFSVFCVEIDGLRSMLSI